MENFNMEQEDITRILREYYNRYKVIIISVCFVSIALIGYVTYLKWYLPSQEEEAREYIWQPLHYFKVDSLDLALYGDGFNEGFLDVADTYSGTKTAAISSYSAGIVLYKKEEYQEAISYFEGISFDNKIFEVLRNSSIGDCYVQLQDYANAIEYYDRATRVSENMFFVPIVLKKKMLVYIETAQYDKVVATADKIISDYPKSSEFQDAQKFRELYRR